MLNLLHSLLRSFTRESYQSGNVAVALRLPPQSVACSSMKVVQVDSSPLDGTIKLESEYGARAHVETSEKHSEENLIGAGERRIGGARAQERQYTRT